MNELNNWTNPTNAFLVQKIVAGCYKKAPSFDARLPITKDILTKLLSALDFTAGSRHLCALYKAMFSVAFHAFLRVGEMTVSSAGTDNPHNLLFSQIAIEESLSITFTSFKHCKGPPFVLIVSKQPESLTEICPVRLLQQYLGVRGAKPGALFQNLGGCAVTRSQFNKALKNALHFCRLPASKYKGHSFRIGAATEACKLGKSDSQIRQLGRWNSNAFQKYIRSLDRVSSL